MEQIPEIMVLGLRVQEPTTVLTDWLITLFAFIFANRLIKTGNSLAKYYSIFFILMGLSTLTGGFAHAFNYEYGRAFHRLPWLLSGLSTFFFMLASNKFFRARGVRRFWEWTPFVFIILYTVAIFNTLSFAAVGIGTAVGLLGYVLPLHLLFDRPSAGKKEFFIALSILVASGIIAALKLGFSQWFNHNDIGHILLILALYQFLKRAQLQAKEAP